MNKSQLEEQRRKRGQCLSCGQKCFQKKLFKLIPIDDHGNVLNGRCLKCRPLDPKKGEHIPAVSRPATQQDMDRFTRSQSSLSMAGSGVRPMSTPRRVQSVNPQKTSSSGVSIESLSSARSVPAVRNDCARSTASYDDDLDDDLDHDYDNGSLRSRESAIAPPVRPRRVNSTGGPAQVRLRRGEIGVSSRSMDSARGSLSAPPFTIQTIPPPPYVAPSPIIEDYVKARKNDFESSDAIQRAMLGSMAAHKLASDIRNRRPKAPPIAETTVAAFPVENLFAYHDEADQEDSFGSMRSHDRFSLNSIGNGSYKTADDDLDYNIEPIHGVLNRGGTMHFVPPGLHEQFDTQIGLDPPFTPFSALNTESSRTMSSMSSVEDEFGTNGRQRSWKAAAKFAQVRSPSAVFEDDGEISVRSSHSKPSHRSSPSSKPSAVNRRQEQELMALETLLNAGEDFHTIVEVMKANKHLAHIQKEALRNLSTLHLTNEQYADIFSIGVLACTVAAMKNHPHNHDLQINGCRAIWNLSATPQNQLKLVSCGALDVILTAMSSFPDDAEVQEKAMAALSNLGAAERNQDRIIERNVMEKIVEAMNRHSEDGNVQAKACAAITNFASYDSPLKRRIMECGGGGAVVVSMIMHPEDVDLQEKALRALRNICANSDENKVEVASVGGIDAVISAMQVHRDEPGVQEAGAWTLSNLAVNPDNKAVIGDSGGIDVIIRAMWVHSDHVGVQEWCCRALWTLSVDAQNRQVMMEVGGISAIINCMQAHADAATVQEKGCGVLSNLSATDDACKIRMVEEEALDAIVMAMVLHADNRAVQDRACSVIKRLAIPPNLKPMQAANVAELVKQAGLKFPDRCGDKARQILLLL